MQRPIVGFGLDARGDWTARLSCGHAQHVRHDPPFVNRPWVTTPDGRASRLGAPLECRRCDALEIPDGFAPTRRTPEFTPESMPPALRADHTLGAGLWARIVVTEGAVRYRAALLGVDVRLVPGVDGVVAPEVPHAVEPLGAARFYVEFYAAPER